MHGNDILVTVTTLSFDITGLKLYLPLTLGAKVVIASQETASDGMLLDPGWHPPGNLKMLCGGDTLVGISEFFTPSFN